MPRQSAGLIAYRRRNERLEFFLVHPGGPFWMNKDAGAWSIPKGEYAEDEDPLAAAEREFTEETGQVVSGDFLPLSPIKQKGGKRVVAWLIAADFDAAQIKSNVFTMQWPPRSGKLTSFPEVDRADWFAFEAACEKILESQKSLLVEANELLTNQRKVPGN